MRYTVSREGENDRTRLLYIQVSAQDYNCTVVGSYCTGMSGSWHRRVAFLVRRLCWLLLLLLLLLPLLLLLLLILLPLCPVHVLVEVDEAVAFVRLGDHLGSALLHVRVSDAPWSRTPATSGALEPDLDRADLGVLDLACIERAIAVDVDRVEYLALPTEEVCADGAAQRPRRLAALVELTHERHGVGHAERWEVGIANLGLDAAEQRAQAVCVPTTSSVLPPRSRGRSSASHSAPTRSLVSARLSLSGRSSTESGSSRASASGASLSAPAYPFASGTSGNSRA